MLVMAPKYTPTVILQLILETQFVPLFMLEIIVLKLLIAPIVLDAHQFPFLLVDLPPISVTFSFVIPASLDVVKKHQM